MTGPPPRAAWIEIRDPEGELLQSVPADVSGGSISAELPAFPPGTYGTVQLCTDWGDSIEREDAKLRELPTNRLLLVSQIG